MSDFEVAAGSIQGHDHALASKNNQDAICSCERAGHIVVVVADGCGSGAHSEVGAAFGVRAAALSILQLFARGSDHHNEGRWSEAHENIRCSLIEMVRCMSAYESTRELIEDYFLFTLVGVLVSPDWTTLFSIGDGVSILNGVRYSLDTSADNTPPYIGYSLLSNNGGWHEDRLQFKLRTVPTSEVQSVLIATDGANNLDEILREVADEDLRQFWTEDRYFKNRDMVRRRLAMLNRSSQKIDWAKQTIERQHPPLGDDTTLAVVRRRP